MPRKKKPSVLMSDKELRTIHHLTTKERRNAYTRLSHYLLAVHYLGRWLELQWITPVEYRHMEKALAKQYGLPEKSILRPECRRRLEK